MEQGLVQGPHARILVSPYPHRPASLHPCIHASPNMNKTPPVPRTPSKGEARAQSPSHGPASGFCFPRQLVQEEGLLLRCCSESRQGSTRPEAELCVQSGRE